MDPDPQQMVFVRNIGADRVELYTEPYAASFGLPANDNCLAHYVSTAKAAIEQGLGVNAGHDLNQDNLPKFAQALPGLLEVSIGHALIADALEVGYAATVHGYLKALVR
jgi:pyridoxine 5-phosphate synthase